MDNMDLQTFRSAYAGEISKAQKSRGFRGVLDQLNGFLDQQIANKQDKEKIAGAQAFQLKRDTTADTVQAERDATAQKFQTERDTASVANAAKVNQDEIDRQNLVNEKIAPWNQAAQQAATTALRVPNDFEAVNAALAGLEEARMQVDQLGGPGTAQKIGLPTSQGVRAELAALRQERQAAHDGNLADMKMKAITDAQAAMDNLAAADPNDKAAYAKAYRAFQRATVGYQSANDPQGYLKAAGDFMSTQPGGGFGDTGDLMTPEQQNAMVGEITKAGTAKTDAGGNVIPGVDVSLLPRGATINPDSAAVARAMLSQMTGKDSTDAQVAADVRSSMRTDFLKPKKRNVIGDIISPSHPQDDTKAAIEAVRGKKLKRGLTLEAFTAGIKEKFPGADVQKVLQAVSGF